MKKIFFALLFAAFAFSSCSTLQKSTARYVGIEAEINQYPTVTDLELADKAVTAEVTWNWSLLSFGTQGLNDRKMNLIADMLKKHNADVLVEPRYQFVKTSFGPRKLTVTGYPAKYKNFRSASEKDLKAVETAAKIQKIKKEANKSQGFFGKLF